MKINLFVRLSLALLVVIFAGCSKQSSHIVRSIVDMTEDETASFDLQYDREGRLISLGEALITYDSDKVSIGSLKSLPGFGELHEITYRMSGNALLSCEARIEELISGKRVGVLKKTVYTYADNKMIIDSKSYSAGEKSDLLKTYKEIRTFSADGKLMEAQVEDSDRGNMIFYYRYCSNIVYEANINLQAYAFCTNGADDLFAYLLGLYNSRRTDVLPNEILLKHPDGNLSSYSGNYRMKNDYVTTLEVMQDYEIPVARVKFEYN